MTLLHMKSVSHNKRIHSPGERCLVQFGLRGRDEVELPTIREYGSLCEYQYLNHMLTICHGER